MATAPKVQRRTEPKFLRARPDDFWNRLGIYPKPLRSRARQFNERQAAKAFLTGLGRGNLRLLCEEARVANSPSAPDGDLTEALLREADIATALHLQEFSKRRTEWIEKVYSTTLSEKKRRAIDAAVAQLGRSSGEKLKTLTKLLLIYRKSPAALLDIFIYETWYRRSTHFEYAVSAEDASGLFGKITRRAKQLASRFSKVTRYGISLLTSHELPEGLGVWVFLREYPARIRRDFHNEYNVSHDCGLIVLGFDPQERAIHFRSGNKQLAAALCEFADSDLDLKLNLLRDQIYSEYDPEQVRTSLLGDYSNSHGVEIVEAAFGRSSLPGREAISLRLGFMQSSIKEALQVLNSAENSYLDIRGAADIETLAVAFRGRTAEIKSEVVKGGAVRLNFENAGWETDDYRDFEAAFLDTFGVPLNRLIDPSVVTLGQVGVIGYLLGISSTDEIEGYHEEIYETLLDKGILRQTVHPVYGCRNNFCSERGKTVGDEARQTCRRCDKPLEHWTLTGVERDQAAVVKLVAAVLERATGLRFDPTERTLERHSYYRLVSPNELSDDQAICVTFADRSSQNARFVFERASLPMIVVRPATDGRKVYVDFDNVGHLSLSYVIAAQERDADRDDCDGLCKTMVERLLMTHKERLEKAARHSYAVLTGDRVGLDGDRYEVEIFNLLRMIFPYSFRLGRKGKEEPDGFASIPDYRDISEIADVGAWNLSYDAKFSDAEGGYAFGASERRQMLHYISRFARNKQVLVGRDGRIRAHLIVSNNISDAKVAAATSFLYGKDGLKGKARDVQFVVVQETFVLELFAWIQVNADEFHQKRPYFYEALLTLLEQDCKDNHLTLGPSDAGRVITAMQSSQAIEKRVPASALKKSLDDTTSLI